MWFGTLSGLNRFDGYEFKRFRRDLQDSASLSEDHIMAVCDGPEDKLWIRTRSGMNIYDPVTESFDRYPGHFLEHAGIPTDIIEVQEGNDGHYWFLTDRAHCTAIMNRRVKAGGSARLTAARICVLLPSVPGQAATTGWFMIRACSSRSMGGGCMLCRLCTCPGIRKEKEITGCYVDGGDCWNWNPDYAGNSWLMEYGDYGTMTFSLRGGPFVTVDHQMLAGRGTESLTEDAVQFGVFRRDACDGAAYLVYNYVSQEYVDGLEEEETGDD